MALRVAYSNTQIVPFHGVRYTRKVLVFVVPILTTDLVTGGQVALGTLPKGARIHNIAYDLPQLDSNGAPTLTVSLGDGALSTRYINAGSLARGATGSQSPGVTLPQGVLAFQQTADTDLLMTFTAGAATAVAGTVTVVVDFDINV